MGSREMAFEYRVAITFESLGQTSSSIQRRNRIGRLIRRTSDDHAIEYRTQGINIPAGIRHCVEIGLLRCHVKKCAQRRCLFVGQAALSKVR